MKTNGTKKLTKEIVRNLLDTILNPIYEGLKYVMDLLKEGNLTWDPFNKEMIEISTLGTYYDYRYYPNFEQLVFTEFPELLNLNQEYDQKRKDLNDACSQLYDELIQSDELRALLVTKINEFEKIGAISKSNAEYALRSDPVDWIAKYIVNNIKQLPDSHILHNIWNNESGKFFSFLENETIRPIKNKRDETYNSFQLVANKTFEEVKKKNADLSLKYGVPIVLLIK